MRALRWDGPSAMSVGELPEPTAGPGEAVVEVALAGICGSDVSAYRGTMGTARPGDVRGHEFAGTVAELGPGVDPRWRGRFVTVNSQVTCGRCWACRSGRDNLCPDLQIIGVHRPGAFARRVVVPARNLAALDESVSLELAATAEPLAQACHDVQLALAAQPAAALVIGAGSIGGLVVQSARLLGIDEIVVVEPDERRRAAAVDAGAAAGVGSAEAAAELAKARPEGGFDVVVDAVGSETTRRAAVDLVRRGGRVVLVGMHTDVGALGWFSVIRREISLVGANCFDRSDFEQAVSWLRSGRIRPPAPVRRAGLADGPGVFADLAAGRVETAKTYLDPRR
jgi:2-desacetyl-2-hydroxyethyl bacteriochlorophyllide A dehydrogenase